MRIAAGRNVDGRKSNFSTLPHAPADLETGSPALAAFNVRANYSPDALSSTQKPEACAVVPMGFRRVFRGFRSAAATFALVFFAKPIVVLRRADLRWMKLKCSSPTVRSCGIDGERCQSIW